MKKTLLLALAFSLWAGGVATHAQQTPPGNGGKSKQVADELRVKYNARRDKALKLAKQKNWTEQQVLPNGTVVSLQGVDAKGLPIYYTTDNNTRAAATIRTNELWTGGTLGLNLSGSSPALAGKLGIWDGGALRPTHQELAGRTVNRDASATLSDHATHVAGTMIAKGVNPLAKGMSHNAASIQSWDFNVDVPEIAAAAPGLLISNHSYGNIAGWRANGSVWEFWGAFDQNEDAKFGQYTEEARDWDVIAYNNPYYLIAKSSGNNRSQNGPAVGQPYSRFNAQGVMVPAGNRPAGISNNDGYDIISTYGTAKNIITVGAVEPIANSYQQPSDVKISSFSSWGPTDDGRIKPDVVANGVAVLSSVATADDAYAVYGGTSMSTPNLSGSMFLLQEHYSKLNGGEFMRAATLKSLVIHTTDEAGTTPGPDYIHGWGLANISRAAQTISNGQTNLIAEKTLAQGATETFQVTASGNGPLVVTIAWTDPEGTATTALNDRTLRLVNDLDLRVSDGQTTNLPWVLNPADPSAPAAQGDNVRDNVEQVLVAGTVPGKTYTVTVTHKGTLARGPQAYSIIASGIGGKAVCASAATSTDGAQITGFIFGDIQQTDTPNNCASYSDFTELSTDLPAGQTLRLQLNVGSCDQDASTMARVYIDWNADGDFDDAGEMAAYSGIIDNSTNFLAAVKVPGDVVDGKLARLRVVLMETTNPNDMQPCGTYAKGETRDFRVRFTKPTFDLGITALVSPENGICANPAQGGVSVTLRNFGTLAVSNIPVEVVVSRSNGDVVATLSADHTKLLPALSEVKVTLPGTFVALAGETYTFTSRIALPGDANAANNSRVDQRTVSGVTAPPTLEAFTCGTDAASLRGTGDGTLFWYSAAQGGSLLAAGNNTSTFFKPADKTYYAALNELSAKVGPATKNAYPGGGYNQFGPAILFTAQVPFVIEKARLYIGNPGTITFTVSTLTGNPVSSVTLDVAATRTTAGPGALPNDPSDPGAVYDLNLAVPAPGNYQISIEYGQGATIYRNNAGLTAQNSYPFTVPGVMSITGTTASGTPLAFYYYLYDIQLKAFGCPSPRIAVTATDSPEATAVITPAGPTNLCLGQNVVLNGAGSGTGMKYQWFRNGVAIAGATTNSYTATLAGDYTLFVANGNGCSKTSAPVNVKVNQLPTVYNIAAASPTDVCDGSPVSVLLRATSNVTADITYQWFKDGAPVGGATAATYTATTPGSYSVEFANVICGKVAAAPVTISQGTPEVTAANAVICNTSGSVKLEATSPFGTIFWYDAPTGGNYLGSGPSFTTPTVANTTSYYASVNERSGAIGGPSATTGGGFSSFTGGRMYFDAEAPFVLEKATINVAVAGTMTVVLVDKDFSESVIASVTIPVTVGVKEYDVNLFVPKAGKNYGFQVVAFGPAAPGSPAAAAYRNNSSGAAAFPYKLDGLMSITGTNQVDQTAFYYFLYNWKVKAAGCATAARKQVDVIVNPPPVAQAATNQSTVYFGYTPQATASLTASATSGKEPYTYQWSNGATTATTSVSPSKGTTYTVTVTDALGCTSTASVKVSVVNVVCGKDPSNPKVLVCSKGKNQCVNPSEVPALLNKGGKLGACGAVATRESAEGAEVTAAQVVAFPNPFSRTVTIDIRPETSGYATYQVTSPQGVLVKRLFAGQVEAGTPLRLELDGSGLSSGVYVGRYVSNGEVHTTKLVLKK